jgi:ribosomal protein S18 acetylase RimI-like enzyme
VSGDAGAITLRPYRPADHAAILEICVQTGDAGADATALHDDPRSLTDRYATPYLMLEPALAFVAERHGHVVGYVLGTADTRRFAEAFATGSWAAAEPAGSLLDEATTAEHARHMLIPECDAYPAHLHVDLSAAARGGGVGRQLIRRFAEALPPGTGLHVVVDPQNPGALAFYPRVGFTELRRTADGVVFGRHP